MPSSSLPIALLLGALTFAACSPTPGGGATSSGTAGTTAATGSGTTASSGPPASTSTTSSASATSSGTAASSSATSTGGAATTTSTGSTAASTSSGTAASTTSSGSTGPFRVRVMTGNLTTGNNQSYLMPGIDIFAGLHPDVALVQEFNVGGNTQPELDGFVQAAFGAGATYYRESSSAFQIPNGIVSHFPIASSGSFTDPAVSNRGLTWVQISLPNGASLWAYSLHLLTTSATNRDTETTALLADIQAQVPAGDYLVVGGDFNTTSRTEACVTTLGAATVVTGPYPVDNAGNGDTSTNRNEPHDWVLASPSLDTLSTPALVGTSTFPDGLVVDTRVYTPLSDIAPAQEGDSGASGMQHMAVVRDFLVP